MPHRNERHAHRADGDGIPVPAPVRAVVVGGGVSGLVAARELAISGHAVEVFEATGAFGGCVAPHTVAGLVLDAGAESFATRNTAVADLLAELGLGEDIALPRPGGAWLYVERGTGHKGAALPMPQTGILGIPGDPAAEDVKRAIGAAASLRAAADLAMPVSRQVAEEPLSIGELVRARMGRAVLDTLVAPVVSGVHSADPDTLDVDTVAPGLRAAVVKHGSLARAAASIRSAAPAGSAVAGLSGGMHRLVSALVQDLRERGAVLHADTPVAAIEHAGAAETAARTGEPTSPWAVTVRGAKDAEPRRIEADRIVVATTGPTAVDLLAPLAAGVARHRPQEGAGVSLVTLVVDKPELDEAPRGTGMLVAPGAAAVGAKAITHATSKWAWLAEEAGPGTHVLRLSYGRVSERTSRVADSSDEELRHAAVLDARELLGVDLQDTDVLGWDVVRYGGALPFATTGHRDRVAAFRGDLAAVAGIDVVGAWLAGTGLAAIVQDTRNRIGISAS